MKNGWGKVDRDKNARATLYISTQIPTNSRNKSQNTPSQLWRNYSDSSNIKKTLISMDKADKSCRSFFVFLPAVDQIFIPIDVSVEQSTINHCCLITWEIRWHWHFHFSTHDPILSRHRNVIHKSQENNIVLHHHCKCQEVFWWDMHEIGIFRSESGSW